MGTRAAALTDIGRSPATALGVAADSNWLFADAGFDELGETVPVDLLVQDGHVFRENKGLVRFLHADGTAEWTTIENVKVGDVQYWLAEKEKELGETLVYCLFR